MARIGEDLAKIRKIQGKTLEDVHRSSRIPESVLSMIEDGSIFSSLSTNKTMIRSNVRSFARVLKLNDDDVIAALDKLEKGEDVHFLKNQPQEDVADDAIPEADPIIKPPSKSSHRTKSSKAASTKKTEEPEETATAAESQKMTEETEELVSETPETIQDAPQAESEVTVEEAVEDETLIEEEEKPKISTEVTNSVSNNEISNVDWEQLNRKTKLKRPPVSISWLSVFGAVIVLTLGSLYFVGYFDFLFDGTKPAESVLKEASTDESPENSATNLSANNWLEEGNDAATLEEQSNTTNEVPTNETEDLDAVPAVSTNTENEENNADLAELSSEEVVPSTTNETEDLPEENQTAKPTDEYRFMPVEATSLPAELEVLVYAATDNLAPVRLQWDGLSSLRPYWVEVGQAMRVGFTSELRIRTLNYSRMILVFNGHPITNLEEQFYNDEAGLLVIPRSFFESDPSAWIRMRNPSEGYDGVSKPSKIIDRPTFN